MSQNQLRFVEEYLKDLNGTQAAIRAGYSPKGATVAAARLLANDNIAALVKQKMALRAKRTMVTQDQVVNELRKIAFTSMGELATWNESGVTYKDSSQISDDARASVLSVEELTNEHGGSLKIKQHDRLKALELLGKHLGMFTEQSEVHHTIEHNDYIEVESETLITELNAALE